MSEVKKEELKLIWSSAFTLLEHTYTVALAHLYKSGIWEKTNLIMGIAAIIFTTIAGSSLLLRYQDPELIAGILSIVASIIVAISTFVNPGKRSQEHFNAGTSYLGLKNEVQFFYEVESKTGDKNNKQLRSELSELRDKSDELGIKCPRISHDAYNKVKEDIKKEIDRTGVQPPP